MTDKNIDEEHLQDILKASYQPQREAEQTLAKRGYKYDYELSNMENKVFFNPETGQSHIAYRGSTRAKDWVGNLKSGLGLKDQDVENRVKLAGRVQEKYGNAPTTYGHSRAGLISERAGEKYGGKSYTYNKATVPTDIFKTIRPEQTDIRTSKDIVSALSVTQRGGTRQTLSTPSGANIIQAHTVSQLTNKPQQTTFETLKNKASNILSIPKKVSNIVYRR
jgi:hypothetical protein